MSEAIGARWNEVDLDAGPWIVPADCIKSGHEHHVPLAAGTIAVLKGQLDRELVFPGLKIGKSSSNMAILELLQADMGKPVTVHGFRSTFKDWCRNLAKHPDEASELALAHVSTDATRGAYARDELLPMRSRLNAGLGEILPAKPAGKIILLRRSK